MIASQLCRGTYFAFAPMSDFEPGFIGRQCRSMAAIDTLKRGIPAMVPQIPATFPAFPATTREVLRRATE